MPERVQILVADDDPVNLLVIQAMLKKFGREYVTATDGDEAATIALATQPRLVLMDISMPKMDGVAATREIRRCLDDPHIPIVAVTANVSNKQRAECSAAGFDGFLPKPVDMGALRKIVDKYVA